MRVIFCLKSPNAFEIQIGSSGQSIHNLANTLISPPTHPSISQLTFPRSLEEEPDHQNLQHGHTHHHKHLDETEIEYPLLGAADGAKVSVLSGAKVFLHSADGAQLTTDFEDGVFEGRVLFGAGAGFLRQEGGFGFIFDLEWEGADHVRNQLQTDRP